jgi:hypothetical protein
MTAVKGHKLQNDCSHIKDLCISFSLNLTNMKLYCILLNFYCLMYYAVFTYKVISLKIF